MTPTIEQQHLLEERVYKLLLEAVEQGMTFTVTEVPTEPLRMGGKVPRVEVHVMTPTYRQQLNESLRSE